MKNTKDAQREGSLMAAEFAARFSFLYKKEEPSLVGIAQANCVSALIVGIIHSLHDLNDRKFIQMWLEGLSLEIRNDLQRRGVEGVGISFFCSDGGKRA